MYTVETNLLSGSLSTIEQAELVRRLGDVELAYQFKHALVQDIAYASLLKQERKRLHRAIGATLERTYDERADEFAAELARHFAEAGDDAKTFYYAQRAGDAAAHLFAYPEAYTYYSHALEAVARLPDTPEQRRKRVDITVKLVAVSLRNEGPAKSLERLRIAETLVRDLGSEPEDRVRAARVHFWMGDAYSHLNQQREAIDYLQKVLAAAQEGIADETLLAIPSNVIGRALVAQGKFAQAEPLLAQAAPLLEKSANWYEWILAVGFLGFALAAQGKTEAGLQETRRAFARARELGTPIGMRDSHVFTSFIYMQRGEYDLMLEHANTALAGTARVEDHLITFVAYNVRAWAHTRLENFEKAEASFAQAQAMAADMGGQLFFADMFQAAYAELALRQGRIDDALERAERGVEMARQVGSLFSEGLAQRVWAQALAARHARGAEERFDTSEQLFEAGSAHIEAARTRAARGKTARVMTMESDDSLG